jgi:hypothetical protein
MQKALEKGPAQTVKHGADQVRVVSHEHLHAMFKEVHGGKDHAANVAYKRALQDAGDSVVIVTLDGEKHIGAAPGTM